MKLKNKKTGETGYYLHTHRDYKTGVLKVAVLKDGVPFSEFKPYEPIYDYDSLAELNEEWCDYEEPEEYWHIAELCAGLQKKQDTDNGEDRFNKQIGNYFETEEEAELAVRKLKAWKRLKDKGLRFCGHDDRDRGQLGDIVIYAEMSTFEYDDDSTKDDLDICFGGEE